MNKTGNPLWKPGVSGNPNGRPKGSKNALTLLREAVLTNSEEIILKHFPKIVEAVARRAMEGDVQAAKLLFDRVLPTKKSVEVTGKAGNEIIVKVVRMSDTVIEATEADFEEIPSTNSEELCDAKE